MIIHISGASGSGKSYLGNKLKKKLGKKVIVKDLDVLRDEFINKNYDTSKSWTFETKKYQKYINNFIKKQKKPIIFVGLNDNSWERKNKKYYNLKSDYNYYIDIDDEKILKQKCKRFINSFLPDILNDYLDGKIEEKNIMNIIKDAVKECSKKETIRLNKIWKRDYKKQGYKFMTSDKIYKEVCKKILF